MKLFAYCIAIFLFTGCAASSQGLPEDIHLKGKISYTSDESGQNQIYVMNADGSDATMLNIETAARDEVLFPSWSPDGRCVSYISGNRYMGGFLNFADADGSNTWQVTTVSGLTREQTPAWSPDGQCVAVSVGNMLFDLFLVCADGRIHQLTNDPGISDSNYDPAWSPDGQHIAFTSTTDYRIHIINRDGSNRVKVTAPELRLQQHPTWSPDGSQIVFVGEGEEHSDLYLVDIDSLNNWNAVEKITDLQGGKGILFSPTWSPDGGFIAFSSTKDGSADIYVLGLEDKEVYKITYSAAEELDPVWYDPDIDALDNSLCPAN